MIISTTRKHLQGPWLIGGAVAAGVLGAWWVASVVALGGGGEPPPLQPSATLAANTAGPPAAARPQPPSAGQAPTARGLAPSPVWWGVGAETVLPWSAQAFRADAQGRLVVDAGTLRTLEQVVAFSPADGVERSALETAAAQRLPEPARAQAVELARRFDRYEVALRQTVSPQHAPASVDEVSAHFQAIQALRREQFGDGVAGQLFGEEEAVTARLIQLMQEDAAAQDPLEAKAMRAQARLSAERSAGS